MNKINSMVTWKHLIFGRHLKIKIPFLRVFKSFIPWKILKFIIIFLFNPKKKFYTYMWWCIHTLDIYELLVLSWLLLFHNIINNTLHIYMNLFKVPFYDSELTQNVNQLGGRNRGPDGTQPLSTTYTTCWPVNMLNICV